MNFTDTKGEWPQIKAYIDSKIQDSQESSTNISLQSYIQKQVKPLGLQCYVGDFTSSNNAFNASIAAGQFVYGSSYILDTKTSVITKNNTEFSGSFYKYFKHDSTPGSLLNSAGNEVFSIRNKYDTGINCLTESRVTINYFICFHCGAILIIDKSLNLVAKKVVIDTTNHTTSDYCNALSSSVLDCGDDGIVIKGYFSGILQGNYINYRFNYIFKNGEFVTYDNTFMRYRKGNNYYNTGLNLLTDNLSINHYDDISQINVNGQLVLKIATITNLSENKEYPVYIDQTIFGGCFKTSYNVLTIQLETDISHCIQIFKE